MRSKVLLIYTGGTIGMMEDPKTGSLIPFDFQNLQLQVPELARFDIDLSGFSLEKPIDSSDMHPGLWVQLTETIEKRYDEFDGFVILHGSDTMAFTASALSFMLEDLAKPVILTGSQLPIGVIRTDGKENLITAIEIAAAKNKSGKAMVPEVAIYFEYRLYRGNRTNKFNSEHFDAFLSPNYPALAEAGVLIKYNHQFIKKASDNTLKVHTNLDPSISCLKIYPGISRQYVESVLTTKGTRAVIMETYGSGNGPTASWFLSALKSATEAGVIILNITQCSKGSVIQGKYETSRGFQQIGVVSGGDLTFEAAVTKLMFLLGSYSENKNIIQALQQSLRGELTEA